MSPELSLPLRTCRTAPAARSTNLLNELKHVRSGRVPDLSLLGHALDVASFSAAYQATIVRSCGLHGLRLPK